MTEVRFSKTASTFLGELSENNNREWFNAHKQDFVTHVERPFLDVLDALSARLSDAVVPLRGGSRTTFKMNRDVRFSADESPYKTAI
ncbi:MAG: DUF2461 family protein [Pseudomonadota bacterium]